MPVGRLGSSTLEYTRALFTESSRAHETTIKQQAAISRSACNTVLELVGCVADQQRGVMATRRATSAREAWDQSPFINIVHKPRHGPTNRKNSAGAEKCHRIGAPDTRVHTRSKDGDESSTTRSRKQRRLLRKATSAFRQSPTIDATNVQPRHHQSKRTHNQAHTRSRIGSGVWNEQQLRSLDRGRPVGYSTPKCFSFNTTVP